MSFFFYQRFQNFVGPIVKYFFSFFLSLFVLSVPHFWSVSKQIEGVDMSRDQLLRRSYLKKYWDARHTHYREYGTITLSFYKISSAIWRVFEKIQNKSWNCSMHLIKTQLLRLSYPKKYWDARHTHSFDIHQGCIPRGDRCDHGRT